MTTTNDLRAGELDPPWDLNAPGVAHRRSLGEITLPVRKQAGQHCTPKGSSEFKSNSSFHGSFTQFRQLLMGLQLTGKWKAGGCIVLWSATKGTVWFQGPAAAIEAVRPMVNAVLLGAAGPCGSRLGDSGGTRP